MRREADVVILGAGFGGLRAARLLGRLAGGLGLHVVIIDKEDHQSYTPALYEIVGGHQPRQVCIPIAEALAGLPVEFIQATVRNVVANKRLVELADGSSVRFRYLIVALGSTTNYYGIRGVQEHAFPLKSARDAWVLRQHIEAEFATAAELAHRQKAQERHVRFLVAGGGPAGVELAGELASFTRYLSRRYHLPHRLVHIELLEAGPEILGRFRPEIVAYARRTLTGLGVRIHTKSAVKEERVRSVVFGDIKEASETLIWTAGVTIPPVVAKLKAIDHDKHGRLVVDPYLRANGSDAIWVIGDCASVQDSGVAFAALAQAECAAGNIVRVQLGQEPLKYEATVPALAMPVGRGRGVVQYDGIILTGPVIGLAKLFIDLRYFLSILPFSKALRLWAVRRERCPNCGRRFREMLWTHDTIA